MVSFNRTILSCSSYVCAFSFTLGSVCGLGCDSKFVLNSESISVDLPSPVSPMHMMLNRKPFWTLLLTS
uniref:Putative secreted protein n=1 Tax=Anopheles marajoara TaxID=58244 RepID=A0A2M4CG49_9DIPT